MYRKLFALTLIISLAISIVGCGGKDKHNNRSIDKSLVSIPATINGSSSTAFNFLNAFTAYADPLNSSVAEPVGKLIYKYNHEYLQNHVVTAGFEMIMRYYKNDTSIWNNNTPEGIPITLTYTSGTYTTDFSKSAFDEKITGVSGDYVVDKHTHNIHALTYLNTLYNYWELHINEYIDNNLCYAVDASYEHVTINNVVYEHFVIFYFATYTESIEIYKSSTAEYVRVSQNDIGTISGANIVFDLNSPDQKTTAQIWGHLDEKHSFHLEGGSPFYVGEKTTDENIDYPDFTAFNNFTWNFELGADHDFFTDYGF
jgi:hypothetical protein